MRQALRRGSTTPACLQTCSNQPALPPLLPAQVVAKNTDGTVTSIPSNDATITTLSTPVAAPASCTTQEQCTPYGKIWCVCVETGHSENVETFLPPTHIPIQSAPAPPTPNSLPTTQ